MLLSWHTWQFDFLPVFKRLPRLQFRVLKQLRTFFPRRLRYERRMKMLG